MRISLIVSRLPARPHRISVAGTIGLVCLFVAAVTLQSRFTRAGDLPRSDRLTGRVTDQDGSPVAGARVAIHEARRFDGTQSMCPACYRECRLTARTTGSGSFDIPNVSSSLKYVLTVSAARYRGSVVRDVTVADRPIEVRLSRRVAAGPDAALASFAVATTDGAPIPGATVEVISSELDGWKSEGSVKDTAPDTVTDDRGVAVLDVPSAARVAVRVTARGFAPAIKEGIRAGAGINTVELREGTMIRGAMNVSQTGSAGNARPSLILRRKDGPSEHAPEIHDAEVGDRGDFVFSDLSPDSDYVFAARLASLQAGYYLPPQEVKTGPPGGVVNLGRLSLKYSRPAQLRVVAIDSSRGGFPCSVDVLDTETEDFLSTTIQEGDVVPLSLAPGRLVRIRVKAPGMTLSRTGTIPGLVRYEDGDILLRVESGGILDVRIAPSEGRQFKALPASSP